MVPYPLLHLSKHLSPPFKVSVCFFYVTSYHFRGDFFGDFFPSDITIVDLKFSMVRENLCRSLEAFLFCSMSASSCFSFTVASLPLASACAEFLLHSASRTVAASGYRCQLIFQQESHFCTFFELSV